MGKPLKVVEVRVRGLERLVISEEVKEALASKGECSPAVVRVEKVRWTPGRAGKAVWARLPLVVSKVASAVSLVVRWPSTKVDLLPARPPRCYRCLEQGHTVANCPYSNDRADRCFRCREQGHVTKSVAGARASPTVHFVRTLGGAPTTSWGTEIVLPGQQADDEGCSIQAYLIKESCSTTQQRLTIGGRGTQSSRKILGESKASEEETTRGNPLGGTSRLPRGHIGRRFLFRNRETGRLRSSSGLVGEISRFQG